MEISVQIQNILVPARPMRSASANYKVLKICYCLLLLFGQIGAPSILIMRSNSPALRPHSMARIPAPETTSCFAASGALLVLSPLRLRHWQWRESESNLNLFWLSSQPEAAFIWNPTHLRVGGMD